MYGVICNSVYDHAFYCTVNVLLAFCDFFNIRHFLYKIGLDLNVNYSIRSKKRMDYMINIPSGEH